MIAHTFYSDDGTRHAEVFIWRDHFSVLMYENGDLIRQQETFSEQRAETLAEDFVL